MPCQDELEQLDDCEPGGTLEATLRLHSYGCVPALSDSRVDRPLRPGSRRQGLLSPTRGGRGMVDEQVERVEHQSEKARFRIQSSVWVIRWETRKIETSAEMSMCNQRCLVDAVCSTQVFL